MIGGVGGLTAEQGGDSGYQLFEIKGLEEISRSAGSHGLGHAFAVAVCICAGGGRNPAAVPEEATFSPCAPGPCSRFQDPRGNYLLRSLILERRLQC